MTCGVPQGSVVGPHLWNVTYDSVLRSRMPESELLVGYADDTALLVRASTEMELIWETETALCRLTVLIENKGLTLAQEKIEAVLLHTRRNLRNISFQMGGIHIKSKSSVKYLGVTFERGCRMVEHVKMVAVKAQKSATALCRLMPNIGGPRSSARRVLGSVVHSVLLYAVPIWQRELTYKKSRKKLEQVQRRVSLRICNA